MSQTCRLAAILAADVAGYSRLIGADEGSSLRAFKTIRAELFDSAIAEYHGPLVKTTGDGFLVEFGSVVMRCAARSRCNRLRPLPARLCDGRVLVRPNLDGYPSLSAGDRARSVLWAGTRFGGRPLRSALHRRR